MPPQNQPAQAPVVESKKSIGPIVGIVVIVIILILGAIYMMKKNDVSQNTAKSDDVSTIESELSTDGNTDVDISGLNSI